MLFCHDDDDDNCLFDVDDDDVDVLLTNINL